ncbi:MAG: chromosomal replication initiator protein DnaA [Myxococcota bacterium]
MAIDRHDPKQAWGAFLESIGPEISGHVLETWFKPIRCLELAGDTAVLEVRDRFSRDWLNDHYIDFLRERLSAIVGTTLAIEWVLNPERAIPDESIEALPDEPSSVSESIHPSHDRGRQLNSRYVFDTFVAGPSNQFALAACKAVAENPAVSYNPLFVFGGVGLGKTHLLCAIGHYILKEKPRSRIIYTSSEQFMNEVVEAVRFSKLPEFHARYRRNCDVILMDDIQLIAGKDRTQHEFFHIFNTLYDSQRQIVVTSDKLPHEIPDIEERLRNRFQWGLIADIQPPEIETRIAILRQKAENDGFELSDDVTFFLARNIRSNIRELEGALIRLTAHASLTKTPITVEYAQQVLDDILTARGALVSVEAVQKLVAGYFQVKTADLKSKRRHKVLMRPRQVAMYLCRKHVGSSYPELGRRFGDKDHTTIMSACRKVENLLKEDASLRKQVMDLERQLDISVT